MSKIKMSGFLGLMIFITSIFLLINQNVHWYPLFVCGGFLLLGSINFALGKEATFSVITSNKRKTFKIYIVYILLGLAVEMVRIIPDLWEYVDPYNELEILPILLFFMYPVFLSFIFESFVLIKHLVKNTIVSFFLTLLFIYVWSEIPNLFLISLWIPNPEARGFIPIIYFVGYVFEIIVPVYVYKLIE